MSLPKLTSDALAPFATVLRATDGKTTRFPQALEMGDVPGSHALTILCPRPIAADTITITSLERHPHSTQTFIPIASGRWLVAVAPTLADGSPDLEQVKAFVAGPEDAVCIGRNVWHAGLTILDRPGEFVMMMWQSDAGDDGVLFELPHPLEFSV